MNRPQSIKRMIEVIKKLHGIGLKKDEITEVILATDMDSKGETTAVYLAQLIKPLGIKVSRLGYGIPVGGDIEYADEVTIARAIAGRKEM